MGTRTAAATLVEALENSPGGKEATKKKKGQGLYRNSGLRGTTHSGYTQIFLLLPSRHRLSGVSLSRLLCLRLTLFSVWRQLRTQYCTLHEFLFSLPSLRPSLASPPYWGPTLPGTNASLELSDWPGDHALPGSQDEALSGSSVRSLVSSVLGVCRALSRIPYRGNICCRGRGVSGTLMNHHLGLLIDSPWPSLGQLIILLSSLHHLPILSLSLS